MEYLLEAKRLIKSKEYLQAKSYFLIYLKEKKESNLDTKNTISEIKSINKKLKVKDNIEEILLFARLYKENKDYINAHSELKKALSIQPSILLLIEEYEVLSMGGQHELAKEKVIDILCLLHKKKLPTLGKKFLDQIQEGLIEDYVESEFRLKFDLLEGAYEKLSDYNLDIILKNCNRFVERKSYWLKRKKFRDIFVSCKLNLNTDIAIKIFYLENIYESIIINNFNYITMLYIYGKMNKSKNIIEGVKENLNNNQLKELKGVVLEEHVVELDLGLDLFDNTKENVKEPNTPPEESKIYHSILNQLKDESDLDEKSIQNINQEVMLKYIRISNLKNKELQDLAISLKGLGWYDLSLKIVESLITDNREEVSPFLQELKYQLLFEIKDYYKIIDNISDYLSKVPLKEDDYYGLIYIKAESYFQLGKHTEALRLFRKIKKEKGDLQLTKERILELEKN